MSKALLRTVRRLEQIERGGFGGSGVQALRIVGGLPGADARDQITLLLSGAYGQPPHEVRLERAAGETRDDFRSRVNRAARTGRVSLALLGGLPPFLDAPEPAALPPRL